MHHDPFSQEGRQQVLNKTKASEIFATNLFAFMTLKVSLVRWEIICEMKSLIKFSNIFRFTHAILIITNF